MPSALDRGAACGSRTRTTPLGECCRVWGGGGQLVRPGSADSDAQQLPVICPMAARYFCFVSDLRRGQWKPRAMFRYLRLPWWLTREERVPSLLGAGNDKTLQVGEGPGLPLWPLCFPWHILQPLCWAAECGECRAPWTQPWHEAHSIGRRIKAERGRLMNQGLLGFDWMQLLQLNLHAL